MKEYLTERIERWRNLLNEGYKTDVGNDANEYAQGQISAFRQVLKYLEENEV